MKSEAGRVRRAATLHLDAPVTQVFPLFDPVGEARWSEQWHPQFVFPASGAVEAGMVFKTAAHGQSETLWVVVAYDPAAFFIEYLRIMPEEQIAQITIRCETSEPNQTNATVTYTVTALGDKGLTAVTAFTDEHYQHWLSTWEMAINHYLHHGQALSHHP